MRARADLLEALIERSESVGSLVQELRAFGWDSEKELVTLAPEHVVSILEAFLAGQLTSSEVLEWANAVESREDIGMLSSHEEVLGEMVFWLANPEMNHPIDSELASRVISNLQLNHAQ